jgi:hypothetical protein
MAGNTVNEGALKPVEPGPRGPKPSGGPTVAIRPRLHYRVSALREGKKQSIGSLTWGQETFQARSGPYGKGSLPDGVYSISFNTVGDGNGLGKSFRIGNLAFFVPITPRFATARNGFGIHPDGNVPGSEGCIVFDAEPAARFWKKWSSTAPNDLPDTLEVSGQAQLLQTDVKHAETVAREHFAKEPANGGSGGGHGPARPRNGRAVQNGRAAQGAHGGGFGTGSGGAAGALPAQQAHGGGYGSGHGGAAGALPAQGAKGSGFGTGSGGAAGALPAQRAHGGGFGTGSGGAAGALPAQGAKGSGFATGSGGAAGALPAQNPHSGGVPGMSGTGGGAGGKLEPKKPAPGFDANVLYFLLDTRDEGGQRPTGILTWNGRRYRAMSGPHGRGALPRGPYTVATGSIQHGAGLNPGMTVRRGGGKFGFFIPIEPNFPCNRTELGIHPDGNAPGSEGCIAIAADDALRFWDEWNKIAPGERPGRLIVAHSGQK